MYEYTTLFTDGWEWQNVYARNSFDGGRVTDIVKERWKRSHRTGWSGSWNGGARWKEEIDADYLVIAWRSWERKWLRYPKMTRLQKCLQRLLQCFIDVDWKFNPNRMEWIGQHRRQSVVISFHSIPFKLCSCAACTVYLIRFNVSSRSIASRPLSHQSAAVKRGMLNKLIEYKGLRKMKERRNCFSTFSQVQVHLKIA